MQSISCHHTRMPQRRGVLEPGHKAVFSISSQSGMGHRVGSYLRQLSAILPVRTTRDRGHTATMSSIGRVAIFAALSGANLKCTQQGAGVMCSLRWRHRLQVRFASIGPAPHDGEVESPCDAILARYTQPNAFSR
jgi:hypothetical protein